MESYFEEKFKNKFRDRFQIHFNYDANLSELVNFCSPWNHEKPYSFFDEFRGKGG